MPFVRRAGTTNYHHEYRRDPLSGELRYSRPGFPPDNHLEYRRGSGHSDELFCLPPSMPGFSTHLGINYSTMYSIPTAIPGSWIETGAHVAATSAAAPPAQFWAKPPRKDGPGIPWVSEMKRGEWHAHQNARWIPERALSVATPPALVLGSRPHREQPGGHFEVYWNQGVPPQNVLSLAMQGLVRPWPAPERPRIGPGHL